ncbi:MAG: hypothetical protein KDB07_07550, partial [Planctomycetes bacterium]|nr:hypothetical protein [Planctomycetota bacterium]
IASRYLALWALGEELQLFQEFCISTITAASAILAAFASVPVSRRLRVLAAERVILTRAISTFEAFAGKFLGVFVVYSIAFVVWVGAYFLALWLFWKDEPTIFSLTQFANFETQAKASVGPLVRVGLLGLSVLAFALVAGMRGILGTTVILTLLYLLIGAALSNWSADPDASFLRQLVAGLFPDFRLGLARESFVSRGAGVSLLGVALQSLGYALLMLLLGAWLKREQEVA